MGTASQTSFVRRQVARWVVIGKSITMRPLCTIFVKVHSVNVPRVSNGATQTGHTVVVREGNGGAGSALVLGEMGCVPHGVDKAEGLRTRHERVVVIRLALQRSRYGDRTPTIIL